MEAAIRLCRSPEATVEERVAGLLLLHQHMAAGTPVDRTVLADIVSAAGGTAFFTGLLGTSRFTGSGGSVPKNARKVVERAAVGFLAQCATCGLLSATEDVLALVDAWFAMAMAMAVAGGDRDDLQELTDLLLMVRWAAKDPVPAHRVRLLDGVLRRARTHVAAQSLPARTLPLLLDLIADLAPALSSSSSSSSSSGSGSRALPLPLSDAAADAARLLLTAGFHGGAPEDVRDAALNCCQQLLAADVDAAWTVEPPSVATVASPPEPQPQPQPQPSPETPPAPPAPVLPEGGRFAVLLLTVVGVEVHLLLEETVALATTADVDAAADTAGTGTTGSGQANDLKPETMALRCARVKKMLPCCFALLSQCLTLLIGPGSASGDGDRDGIEDDREGLWTDLPGAAVLRVRESVHSTLKQLLDFLRDCPAGAAGGALSVADVTALVRQATAALSLWTCEDAALHRPYVAGLPSLLRWSHMVAADAAPPAAGLDDVDTTAGDVVHHVAPCLAAIADDLSADADGADEKEAMGIAEDRDRLCTAAPALFGVLLRALVVAAQDVDRIAAAAAGAGAVGASRGGAAGSTLRLAGTAAAACTVLAALLRWKASDLAALRRGEGDDAALRAVFAPGCATDALPVLPGPAGAPYLRRLGDVLAVASGRLVGNEHPAVVALDDAMCSLLLVLDT